MAFAASGGEDSGHSSFSAPLQSLLSHLPSLSTALPASHPADSQATTAQASDPVSVSSAHTAASKEHDSPRAPPPVTPSPSHWATFHFAHPPPQSRTHGRRRHSYPPLLLQLRRTRPGGRIPRPDLEVYPIVGSIRKEKRNKPVTCGAHELSKEDLVVLRYSIEDASNADVPPLGLGTTALDCDGIVAILHHCICPGQSHTPQNVVLVHGSAWTAAPHPDGGYAFISQDDAVTKRVCWLPRRNTKKNGRATTNPLPNTSVKRSNTTSTSQFVFFPSASGTESKSDDGSAQIDMSAIYVREPQAVEASEADANFSQAHITAVAVATGLWVANREGWADLGLDTGEGSAVGTSADGKSEDSRKSSRSAKMLKLVHRRRASQ